MTQTLPLLRLRALPLPDGKVRFQVLFPAPTEHTAGLCAPATLEPGDGTQVDLGILCVPTVTTWREQHTQDVAEHEYAGNGPFEARLIWGSQEVRAPVSPGGDGPVTAPTVVPEITLFDLRVDQDDPLRATLRVQVRSLAPDTRLRVDGGAGQVYWLRGSEDAEEQFAEWVLYYTKPGTYTVAADVVDADGFWLATGAEATLTVLGEPEVETEEAEPPAPEVAIPASARVALEEISLPRTDRPAWLPFRYARPVWANARTYVTPGGGRVSRILAPGTYLSIRAETLVDGTLWYRTAAGDWIPSNAVVLLQPSDLRGVVLSGVREPSPPPEPPPPPPPPPEPPDEPPPPKGARHGVVTAYILNVRAAPGVRPDNPPIDKLRQGTEVIIYEETTYNGEVWYRIGENRWVHSGWVRITTTTPPVQDVRRGMVTAYILNVRARPGVRPDNPPIDKLRQGTEVYIYEEATYNGEIWYRIGDGRWVHSGWVRVLGAAPRASTASPLPTSPRAEGMALPMGWIVAPTLNVRAEPGVRPDNPPIDQVHYKTVVPILEERTVGGARWYRIGENRWVYGGWVGVARYKPRPASIRPDERWVGVCLKEQTLVAYEGDTPVFAALVATGLPQTPTVQGIFRTWLRLKWGKMSGGSPTTGGYYYLEDVTWTMYFYRGYALHTAYWHDAFGRPRSHGCVNMSPHDAWWVFNWSAQGGDHSPAVYVYWY